MMKIVATQPVARQFEKLQFAYHNPSSGVLLVAYSPVENSRYLHVKKLF